MSGSSNLLNELKQVRYGKTIDEIIEKENIEAGKTMTLKLPITEKESNSKTSFVNFLAMALVVLVMLPIFVILAYYLFS